MQKMQMIVTPRRVDHVSQTKLYIPRSKVMPSISCFPQIIAIGREKPRDMKHNSYKKIRTYPVIKNIDVHLFIAMFPL